MFPRIVIHGGAGTILKTEITTEKEVAYKLALKEALQKGFAILSAKGSAIDAVTAAIVSLEDCPLFNAGKGSVFNAEGRHEMDASIMSGDNLSAGAITGVMNVKNPIVLAKTVMQQSEHVFLMGEGAEIFARKHELKFELDDYFYDEFRYQQWLKIKGTDTITLDHSKEKKFGTVGAVALDTFGNLAAGTSTGGMTNKRYGRVGDSPIIGAGTYANNATCAISCTGHGELFIRNVVAYDISCLMEYKGLSLHEACRIVVHEKLVKIGGEGGLIAIDAQGNIALPFNSDGMYRGWMRSTDDFLTEIYS
ncbi:MAG: isoaspartyl peptidase/L-asparaginase [Bacteroidetes bacterium]|nr:isoaspartyl peptidase/L-asparaginase [Bacteroidota bacterium]